MLEPVPDQEERDIQQLNALLNTGCTMDNLRVAVKKIKILDYCTNNLLEEIHVGLDAGMYAVVHSLEASWGRCIVEIVYIHNNIEIRTKAVGEDIYAGRTKNPYFQDIP